MGIDQFIFSFLHVKEDQGGGVPRPLRARGTSRAEVECLEASFASRFPLCFKPGSDRKSAVVFSSRHNFFLTVFMDSKLTKIQERTPEFMFKQGLVIPSWVMGNVSLFVRSFNLSFCSLKEASTSSG